MDKNAITLGLQIGRILAGQRRKKVPVAYLYGPDEVRLPALPYWDKEKYPYAVIIGSDVFVLWVMDGRPYMHYDYTHATYANYEIYTIQDGAFTFKSSGNNVHVANQPIWSNTDIYYADYIADLAGILYLAASEPVPVYD